MTPFLSSRASSNSSSAKVSMEFILSGKKVFQDGWSNTVQLCIYALIKCGKQVAARPDSELTFKNPRGFAVL